jgi:hypothetical protein
MRETEFGYRIRQALDEGLERLDYRTTYRLEQARAKALARMPAAQAQPAWAPVLATASGPSLDDGRIGWLGRLGLAAPLVAVVIGFVGIWQYQDTRRIAEIADIDFAVLLDEVPLATYADKGFGTLLTSGDSSD